MSTGTLGAFLSIYLAGLVVWIGVGFGSAAVLLLGKLTGGAWVESLAKYLRALSATFFPSALLFLPVLLGNRLLTGWSQGADASPEQRLYLSPPFLAARALCFFLVGVLVVRRLLVDRSFARESRRENGNLYGWSVVAMAIVGTAFGFDWLMALDPGFRSSIYPVIVIVGQLLSAFSLATALWARSRRGRDPISPKVARDVGNLLLAFLLLWTYVSFAQYLVIWSGSLPREIHWYAIRDTGGWNLVALALIVLQFFAPFLLLLMRRIKESPTGLCSVAGMIFLMRFVESGWLVLPPFGSAVFVAGEIVAAVIIGSLLFPFYRSQLRAEGGSSV